MATARQSFVDAVYLHYCNQSVTIPKPQMITKIIERWLQSFKMVQNQNAGETSFTTHTVVMQKQKLVAKMNVFLNASDKANRKAKLNRAKIIYLLNIGWNNSAPYRAMKLDKSGNFVVPDNVWFTLTNHNQHNIGFWVAFFTSETRGQLKVAFHCQNMEKVYQHAFCGGGCSGEDMFERLPTCKGYMEGDCDSDYDEPYGSDSESDGECRC